MKNKEKCFISAVVYTYNSESNIEEFLEKTTKTFKEYFTNSEIIFVNDFSNDKTIPLIKEYAKTVKGISISIMNMSRHYGIELAMNAGIDLSIGDFVYEFDTTNIDYNSQVIIDVYKKAHEGYDIVSASSNKKQKVSSSLFYKLFNKYAENKCELKTETFRLLSRRAINRVRNINKVSPYRKADYLLCGLNNTNIVYERMKNVDVNSDKLYRTNLALDTLLVFTNFGYRLSLTLVAIMLIIAGFMGIYTLVIYLNGRPVEGWTTTIMFLAIAFFGLFLILALVIKYLQLILNLNIQKTTYNYESIEKLSE